MRLHKFRLLHLRQRLNSHIIRLINRMNLYKTISRCRISEAQVDDPDAMAVMARIKEHAERGDNKPFKL